MKQARRTKTEIILGSLQNPGGVTISELCQKLDWQRHSVRAAISRQIRGNLRFTVTAQMIKGRGRVLKVRDKSKNELLELADPTG